MTLAKFRVIGIETIDGFQTAVLESCEKFQVLFEIFWIVKFYSTSADAASFRFHHCDVR